MCRIQVICKAYMFQHTVVVEEKRLRHVGTIGLSCTAPATSLTPGRCHGRTPETPADKKGEL